MKIHSRLAVTAFLILIQCILIVGNAADANARGSTGLPSSHMIANVPWHQQMNGLFCGEGVLEGVYDYYGPDINQKEIADVARSSSAGTWSFDMVRAGHFSSMSSAQGRFFPHEVPAPDIRKGLWVMHPSPIPLINSGWRT